VGAVTLHPFALKVYGGWPGWLVLFFVAMIKTEEEEELAALQFLKEM
jgi:hypothetical protein